MARKQNNYWKKRFETIEAASNAYGQDVYRQIEPAFTQAQREIQAAIDTWYTRIAVNNQVSITEARKMLSAKELSEFKWDVKEFIKYGEQNALDPIWMKQLENASAKYHISRLEAMKIQTQQAMEKAFGNELNDIDVMARKVYTDDFYHSTYEIQKGLGVGWDVSKVDPRRLEKLISKPWAADGKNFSDRVWQSKTSMVNELHNELVRTCILGKSPDKAIKHMTKFVDKKFKNAKYQAGRLVMTEQAFFASAAQKDCFNELDVEEFEVVATLDSHTSEICQDMDGQHFPMKDYEPGVTAPPFHVWCRSTTVPFFDDEWSNGERAARGEDGKTYYVPESMKYKDWKQSFVDGGSKDGLKPTIESDIIKTPIKSNEKHYDALLSKLDETGVEYIPVERHSRQLNNEDIISSLAGGDTTSGSCASVGLAYIGQKQNYNVLDFRGGDSQKIFSNGFNLYNLSLVDGLKVIRAEGKSSLTVGNRLLKQVVSGKEYYLCVGRHAAIVRKTADDVLQYLELQSAKHSGWTDFNGNPRFTLKSRFGCRESDSGHWDFMIDIDDSDFKTDDFRTLLGYINTSVDNQKKGVKGSVK